MQGELSGGPNSFCKQMYMSILYPLSTHVSIFDTYANYSTITMMSCAKVPVPFLTGPSLFDLKLFGFSNHKQDTAEVAKELHRYGRRQTWVFGGIRNCPAAGDHHGIPSYGKKCEGLLISVS